MGTIPGIIACIILCDHHLEPPGCCRGVMPYPVHLWLQPPLTHPQDSPSCASTLLVCPSTTGSDFLWLSPSEGMCRGRASWQSSPMDGMTHGCTQRSQRICAGACSTCPCPPPPSHRYPRTPMPLYTLSSSLLSTRPYSYLLLVPRRGELYSTGTGKQTSWWRRRRRIVHPCHKAHVLDRSPGTTHKFVDILRGGWWFPPRGHVDEGFCALIDGTQNQVGKLLVCQHNQSDNHCQVISLFFDDDCHYYACRQTATQQNKNWRSSASVNE